MAHHLKQTEAGSESVARKGIIDRLASVTASFPRKETEKQRSYVDAIELEAIPEESAPEARDSLTVAAVAEEDFDPFETVDVLSKLGYEEWFAGVSDDETEEIGDNVIPEEMSSLETEDFAEQGEELKIPEEWVSEANFSLPEEDASDEFFAAEEWLHTALLSDFNTDELNVPDEEPDDEEDRVPGTKRHVQREVLKRGGLKELLGAVRMVGEKTAETAGKSETLQKLFKGVRKGKTEKTNTANAVMRASAAFNGEEYLPSEADETFEEDIQPEKAGETLLGRFSKAIPIQRISRKAKDAADEDEVDSEADDVSDVPIADVLEKVQAISDTLEQEESRTEQKRIEEYVYHGEENAEERRVGSVRSNVPASAGLHKQKDEGRGTLDDPQPTETAIREEQHERDIHTRKDAPFSTGVKDDDQAARGRLPAIPNPLDGLRNKLSGIRRADKGEKNRKHAPDSHSLRVDAVVSAVALLLTVFTAVVRPEKAIETGLYLVAFTMAGYACVVRAYNDICCRQYLSDSVLCCFSALLSLCMGSFGAAAVIILCCRCVAIISDFTAYRNGASLAEITSLLPTGATLEQDGALRHVSLKTLHRGDVIRVEPGETIAVDGVVSQGVSEIDISSIAGEADPVKVHAGSKVYAGTVNRTAPLRVLVMEEVGESFADRFIAAAKASAGGKSALLRLAETIAKYLTPAFLAVGFIMLLVRAVARENVAGGFAALTVCVLLAAMGEITATVAQAYVTGIYDSARHGVLFRQSFLVSAMAKVKTVVTTLTGVLTDADFKVTEVHPISGLNEGQLLAIAAAAESKSRHPIARAISKADMSDNSALVSNITIHEESGRGLNAFVGNHHVSIGNALHISVDNVRGQDGKDAKFVNYNGNLVHVAVDGRYCGGIIVRDNIRPNAFEALDDMRLNGVRNLDLLTGAVRSVARSVASALNFDMVKAELTNEEKEAAFAYLMSGKEEGSRLAFIGDYATDSALLHKADIGIAHNVLGDVDAMENADVCMLGTDLSSVADAYAYALKAEQSAVVALSVNLGMKAIVFLFLLLNIVPVWMAAVLLFGAEMFAWINNGIHIDFGPVKQALNVVRGLLRRKK